MPIYSLLCPNCGDRNIMHRKVYERDLVPRCSCGTTYARIIEAPMVIPEIASYISPGSDRVITSRAERREDLARCNALEWEPGVEKDIARKSQYEKEKAFEPIAKAVDNIVTEMNVSGKLGDLHA
jgi:hypothetical protein